MLLAEADLRGVTYSKNHTSYASYEWFWFFYEYEAIDQYQSTTFRPLFMRNIDNSHIFEASLMPILYWRYKTERRSEWKSLLGWVISVDYRHDTGRRDYDLGIFPFLFYGDSQNLSDRYCLVWPFGGTLRGKIGHDRISTYLFPGVLLFFIFPPTFPPSWVTAGVVILSFIPLYIDYEFKDYKAYGFFWPIIQRGRSPDRDDKRFLPFYAHNYKRNRYNNYSILMIFNYQRVFIGDDEQRTFFAFPFYGRRWNVSASSNSSTLLWPFFSWGYDKKRGDIELNFPWPLVQIQVCRSPYIKKRIFFPFYGNYEFRNSETFFITPLFFSLKRHSNNFSSQYYINAFIFWYFKRDFKSESSDVYGNSWRYYKLWPLFQYEYNDRGNKSFNLLSILPLRDPDGYERLYQPFWTILEYRRLQSGEKRLGLILRTYYQRWGKDFLYIKIPFVFSYAEHKNRVNRLSFFLSMFSYNNDRTRRYLRIFWIRINLSESASKVLSQNDSMINNKNQKVFL